MKLKQMILIQIFGMRKRSSILAIIRKIPFSMKKQIKKVINKFKDGASGELFDEFIGLYDPSCFYTLRAIINNVKQQFERIKKVS